MSNNWISNIYIYIEIYDILYVAWCPTVVHKKSHPLQVQIEVWLLRQMAMEGALFDPLFLQSVKTWTFPYRHPKCFTIFWEIRRIFLEKPTMIEATLGFEVFKLQTNEWTWKTNTLDLAIWMSRFFFFQPCNPCAVNPYQTGKPRLIDIDI